MKQLNKILMADLMWLMANQLMRRSAADVVLAKKKSIFHI
jgi:hypothetical protein